MLGTDLAKEWQSDDLVRAGSAEADIRNFAEVQKLVSGVRPDWIVLSAAYTDVDGCERNPELAFAINGRGVENVARAAQAIAARIFLVSTDYVFDGVSSRPYEIDDPIAPLNVYGASKAAGEAALRNSTRRVVHGRTSWLFGVHGMSFPQKILQAAETRPELSVVTIKWDRLPTPAIWPAPFVI